MQPIGLPYSCPDGMIIEIIVATDAFPWETEWILKDNCGLGIRILMTASTQQANFSTPQICLPTGEYEFTITDTAGDGFCCDFGYGWYDIRVDGSSEHYSKGTIGFSETERFGKCVDASTPPMSTTSTSLLPTVAGESI